jgi:formamidase
MLNPSPRNAKPTQTVFVGEYTDGLLDPNRPMLGPVAAGGTIVANTTPGCWGPMITPAIRGGHEVTQPVFVEGAEVGDAIAIRIKAISVSSLATASGNDQVVEGRFNGDPYCAAKCSNCGTEWPETRVEGIGPGSIKCVKCGAEATPFTFTNGYTIVFDQAKSIGVTIGKSAAENIARHAARYAALPEGSVQNPILLFAPSDLVGLSTRLRPFLGQLGTTPSAAMPDSHNAGDFGAFLVGAPHKYAMSAEELARHKTDGHMDVAAVRAGATIVCPVKVSGGGVYLGDMHALQGDGEIAGHTCDVAGHATLQVDVLKGLSIDGPILFPVDEDLPFLARAMPRRERNSAIEIAKSHGVKELERNLPISFIGTGKDLNLAIDNGLQRAADLLQMSVPDVKTVQRFSAALRSAEARELPASRSAPPLRLLRELACELWPRRSTARPRSRPVVRRTSSRWVPHRGKNSTFRESMSVPQLVFLPRAAIAGNAAIFSPRWTMKAS